MRYRKLDANGDRVFGRDQKAFWINVPDGVAQAVLTRLQLYLGEWFLDTSDGTDWRHKVLGNRTATLYGPMLRTRILQTRGVVELVSFASQLNRDTRALGIQGEINTLYGDIALIPTALTPLNPGV